MKYEISIRVKEKAKLRLVEALKHFSNAKMSSSQISSLIVEYRKPHSERIQREKEKRKAEKELQIFEVFDNLNYKLSNKQLSYSHLHPLTRRRLEAAENKLEAECGETKFSSLVAKLKNKELLIIWNPHNSDFLGLEG